MGKDLFECDLDTLTFADVEDFVALGIDEGVRVDYKDQVPQRFGDIVTAFSNAIGGVAILGVQNNNGKPGAMTGIPRNARSDLKTQIANKIVSTVFPRPEFSIAVVPHTTPNVDVAVVRVDEGHETPYMFDGKKVSVRIADRCDWASLSDLERLFQRKALGEGGHVANERRDIRVYTTHPENHTQVTAETFFRCWLWPTQPMGLRLDRHAEAGFRDAVTHAFSDFHGIQIDDRHREWVDLEFHSHTVEDFNARWRLTAAGSVGFVAQPFHSVSGAIHLADVVRDASRFISCGARLLAAFGWQGRVSIEAALIMMDRRILPGSFDRPDALDGIINIGARTNRGAGEWFETFASPGSIDAAAFMAELLMDSLRTERRSEVDFDRLLASVLTIASGHP